jgi:hypothetical protein
MSPPTPALAQAILEKSEKEQKLGLLGPFRPRRYFDELYGRCGWRALKRFAVQQGDDIRVIDNGRSSLHNGATEALETIHTCCIESGLAVAARLHQGDERRQVRGPAAPPPRRKALRRGTRDMKRAFRQLSRWLKQRNLHIVCLYVPHLKEWLFSELVGLAFGLFSSVLHFNAVPSHCTALSRRWLGAPTIHFFDDLKVTATEESASGVWEALGVAIDFTGWLFDEEKDSVMAVDGPFLGALENFSRVPQHGIVLLEPKPSFILKLQTQLDTAIDRGILYPGDARTLFGCLLHAASFVQGRVGRGQTARIALHAECATPTLTPELRASLEFHRALLRMKCWRTVQLCGEDRSKVLIYTDASCEPRREGGFPQVILSYLVFLPDGPPSGAYVEVPDSVLEGMALKHTYISQGEALAVLFCLRRELARLSGRSAIWMVDNLGVLQSLVKGISRIPTWMSVGTSYTFVSPAMAGACGSSMLRAPLTAPTELQKLRQAHLKLKHRPRGRAYAAVACLAAED